MFLLGKSFFSKFILSNFGFLAAWISELSLLRSMSTYTWRTSTVKDPRLSENGFRITKITTISFKINLLFPKSASQLPHHTIQSITSIKSSRFQLFIQHSLSHILKPLQIRSVGTKNRRSLKKQTRIYKDVSWHIVFLFVASHRAV